jgi:hypothetical protein
MMPSCAAALTVLCLTFADNGPVTASPPPASKEAAGFRVRVSDECGDYYVVVPKQEATIFALRGKIRVGQDCDVFILSRSRGRLMSVDWRNEKSTNNHTLLPGDVIIIEQPLGSGRGFGGL